MICEECGEREATCHVTMIAGGTSRTRHLCQDCMEKIRGGLGRSLPDLNLGNLVSSIFSAILPSELRKDIVEAAEPDKACSTCGTTLHTFRKTGCLGCPDCYQAFREELEPMLRQIHGKLNYTGRRPLEDGEEQKIRAEREEMIRQMEEAVEQEDFETAALIRDRLRSMAKEENVCRI